MDCKQEFHPIFICGRHSTYSLVARNFKGKSYKSRMIEASLEFGLHFGQSKLSFLDGVDPNDQMMYHNLT